MTELLLVGVGQMGLPYLAAAERLGIGVRAVEIESRSGPVLGRVAGLQTCRGDLDELWVEAAMRRGGGRPAGVVAFSEPQVMAAALVQDRLGLPGPGLAAAVVSRNKALQRGVFAAASVAQPDYVVTEDLTAVESWVGERLPVVVKPLSSSGSAGVEFVADWAAYQDISRRRGPEGRLLVETAVVGPEFSWEAMVHEGRVWFANVTAKETSGPPHFIEVTHRTVAPLDPVAAQQVDRLAHRVLSALRMSTGLVHLEFRMTAQGPVVMEVAVRTPGDFLMDLLGLTYGCDWFELVVRAAVGWPLPEPPTGPVRYAASYLPTAEPGVVVANADLDRVLAHPDVVMARSRVRVGDIVPLARSSVDRVGHVVTASPSPDAREAVLAAVRQTFVVTTAATSTGLRLSSG